MSGPPILAPGPAGGPARDRPLGLLIDYAGVLTVPVSVGHAAWCRTEHLAATALDEGLRSWQASEFPDRNPVHLVEAGRLSPRDFERALAARLSTATGRTVEPRRLLERLLASFAPDHGMVEAVRQIRRSGVRTALVTNSWGSGSPWECHRDLFDAAVVSCQVGMRKPDQRIYRLAAAQIGVPAGRCVFVDDHAANVAGARAAGMTAVRHDDPAATRQELSRLFALALTK